MKIQSVCCFVLILQLQAIAYGQQRGNVEAFRAGRDADRRAMNAEINWQQSTKLTNLKQLPAKPRNTNVQESELVPEATLYLEDWSFKVLSISGASDVLLVSGDRVVWLEGYPTKDLVDQQDVRLVGPVKVTGTKSYTTVENTQSKVRSLKLLSLTEIEAVQKAEAEAEEAKQYRKFTDSTGKHSFEGKFIEYKNSMAVLLRKDTQKTVEVKLAQLSREDGDWIRAEIKSRREKAEAERKSKAKK